VTEEQGLIIARIKGGQTEEGKPVVELFEDNPKFKYPTLRLFDPSQLFTVGVDPNGLKLGDELYVRFRAWFVESDRLNKEGNAYKDVVRLEKLEDKQDGSRDDLASVIALLQSIDRRLASIHQISEVVAAQIMRQVEEDDDRMRTPDPPLTDVEKERLEKAIYRPDEPAAEPEEHPVLNEDMARRRFGELAGPAMRAGKLDRTASGKLTSEVSAGAMNWRTALQRLEAAIAS